MSDSRMKKMSIDVAIKLKDHLSFDVYLFLNNRFVKVSHKDDPDKIDVLIRYKERGEKIIFVDTTEYLEFVAKTTQKLNKVSPKNSNTQKTISTLNTSHILMKQFIEEVGICDKTIEMAQKINSGTMKQISIINDLKKFIIELKKTSSFEFSKCLLTSFVCSWLIDTYPWQSPNIKAKASMAALLCDINLSEEDFESLKQYTNDARILTKSAKAHPITNAQILKMRMPDISNETIQMIEQHHEDGLGTGYPNGLHQNSINLLSTIFIISYMFTEKVIVSETELNDPAEVVESIASKYRNGKFRKVSLDLMRLVKMAKSPTKAAS